MTSQLAKIVAANVRAQAALRGQTQTQVAQLVDLAQAAVSDRYRERRQWQLEDLEKLAEAWGVEPGELLARPKGFEPLTFWLGADHTMTEWAEGAMFCDVCGAFEGWARDHAWGRHGETWVGHTRAVEDRFSSLLAERYPLGASA